MAGIYGILGYADGDRTFVNVIGQEVVYDASLELLNRYNADLNGMLGLFIEMDTESHIERYKLPGGGRLQRRGGQTSSAAMKAVGSYDVAYPLEEFGAQIGGDRVSLAYMTLQEYQRHLDTIMIANTNTMRY